MTESISIASSGIGKSPVGMDAQELQAAISDLGEIIQYLTREEASYEERCFAEQVRAMLSQHVRELESRSR